MNHAEIQMPPDTKKPSADSDTFPIVMWFSCEMEHKLWLNRHKGDRAGWRVCNPIDLMERLKQEAVELGAELCAAKVNKEAVIKECADVANFAMMIADLMRDSKMDDSKTFNSMEYHD